MAAGCLKIFNIIPFQRNDLVPGDKHLANYGYIRAPGVCFEELNRKGNINTIALRR